MALKDITITGSIGSIPTQSYGQKTYVSSNEQESFPIEHISGSDGGSVPNFNGQHYTTKLFVNITQSWTSSLNTPVGLVSNIHNTQEEFINGEYSGSKIISTNGSLIDSECEQFLKVNTIEIDYKPFFFYSSGSNAIPIGTFLDYNTSPNDGEIYLYWNYTPSYTPGGHEIPVGPPR